MKGRTTLPFVVRAYLAPNSNVPIIGHVVWFVYGFLQTFPPSLLPAVDNTQRSSWLRRVLTRAS